MQCCRDGLHPLVAPRPKTSQPPRGYARGRNSQVERGGPKAHRDHGKASNRKSIETGRDHQNKQCASARSYRDAGDQSDRIACCRQRCHVVGTRAMGVATTAVCDVFGLRIPFRMSKKNFDHNTILLLSSFDTFYSYQQQVHPTIPPKIQQPFQQYLPNPPP